jgi:hypothetical protein
LKRFLWLAFILGITTLVGPLGDLPAHAWFDETHISVAKVTGYAKWFNACGPDMIKIKMGEREAHNHYANNPRGSVVTPGMVMAQVENYDRIDQHGHLYGAIIASLRHFIADKKEGKYGEYHLAFCAHYVGDLSQPLHNTEYDAFNKLYDKAVDGTVNGEVLANLDRIKIYSMTITGEIDLAREIARIANLSLALGYRLEDEKRMLTRDEAYLQLGHSASLFKAILQFAEMETR